jgi:F0F1-type ATP synthase assembly protein I
VAVDKDAIHSSDQPHPDASRDPRLQIPETLTRPVPKSNYDPLYGSKEGRRDSGESASDTKAMGKAWAIAMNFVFTIIAGLLLGWGFDVWRGTRPWGLLGGLVFGFVGAFIVIVRQTNRDDRREREARERRRGA